MFYVIIIMIIIILFLKFKSMNIVIKWNSIFKKGIFIDENQYGVYCYCGKQGSGKTFSVVRYLLDNKDKKIYSNVKSLKGVEYNYISNFQDLLNIENDTSDNIIIFYDEIFTALAKGDKMSKRVLSFLSQMRKRKIIFITTAQEWLEINVTLRRYVRYQINCSIYNLFGRSWLFKEFNDGTQLHWDKDENDYIAPLICFEIEKMNKYVADSYDTYETIQSSN